MEKRLLDVHEVSQYLGLHKIRVYELTRAGLIPCVRVGARIKWDRLALDRWIEAGGAGGAVRRHRDEPGEAA